MNLAGAASHARTRVTTGAVVMWLLLSIGTVGRSDVTFLPISELDGNEYSPSIAYNSIHDEYLVVWHDVYDVVHARRVSSTGLLLNSFEVSTSLHGGLEASVAYDPGGDRYLVTWTYDYSGNATDYDIYGRFIPWDGPSPGLIDFPISSATTNQWRSSVAFGSTADAYMVVWMSERPGTGSEIFATRVSADGSGLVDSSPIASGDEDRDYPDVAYDSTRNEFLVTWDVDTAAGGDIYALRLSAAGATVGGEFGIADFPSDERIPSVASCGAADQYLVAWESDQDTGGVDRAIYARYVDGKGVAGNIHLIDDTTALEEAVELSCDATGQEYFLAWQTLYAAIQPAFGIWGRVAHPDEVLDPSFAIVQPGLNFGRTEPAVGGGETKFLIAWEHDTGFIPNRNIWGLLVPIPEPAAGLSLATAAAALATVSRARRRA